MNLVKWSDLFKNWIKLGVKVSSTGTHIFEGGDFSDADFNIDFFVWPETKLYVSKITETPIQFSWHQLEDFHTGLHMRDTVFSIFAKADERRYLKLSTVLQDKKVYDVDATFDLALGVVLEGSGGIIPMDDGWYRCYVTNMVQSTNPFSVRVMLVNEKMQHDYAGKTGQGLFIAGAQFEYGIVPSSQDPTYGYPK